MNEQLEQLEQSVSRILEEYRALKVENDTLKSALESSRAETLAAKAECEQLKNTQSQFESQKAESEAKQAEFAQRLDAVIGALQSGAGR